MKKKLLFVLAAGLLLIGIYGTANATVIDFNEIDNTGFVDVVPYFGNSLDSKGFNFTNSFNVPAAIVIWARTSPYNADPNGATYSHNYQGTTTTLTQIGGETFDLQSLDIGDVFNAMPNPAGAAGTPVQTYNFTGHQDGGATLTSSFTSDALPGLQTVTLDWTNLVAFEFSSGSWLQADNFVINEKVTAPVPEPSTVFLFGAGLGGLALFRRKARKS